MIYYGESEKINQKVWRVGWSNHFKSLYYGSLSFHPHLDWIFLCVLYERYGMVLSAVNLFGRNILIKIMRNVSKGNSWQVFWYQHLENVHLIRRTTKAEFLMRQDDMIQRQNSFGTIAKIYWGKEVILNKNIRRSYTIEKTKQNGPYLVDKFRSSFDFLWHEFFLPHMLQGMKLSHDLFWRHKYSPVILILPL